MPGIQITHVGRQKRDGTVGQLLSESLPFKVTEDGKPVTDEWVTVDSDPEGAGVFPPSDESYASIQTDKAGIARVQFRPMREGEFTIRATVRGETKGVFRMTICRNTGPQMLGPNVIDARRRHGGVDATKLAWPIAAMVIAALAIGGALLLFGRDGGKAQSPIVVRSGPSSTVDATARAEAQAARAAVDRTAAELRGEIDSGLAANSAHDRGYGREYGRPTLRLALENARRIAANRHGDEPSASWRPPICRSYPDLPACKE